MLNIGLKYLENQLYTEAEHFFTRALESLHPEDEVVKAHILRCIGEVWLRKENRDMVKAQEYISGAMTIYRKYGHSRGKIKSHLLIGEINQMNQRYDSARLHYQKAKTILEDKNLIWAGLMTQSA